MLKLCAVSQISLLALCSASATGLARAQDGATYNSAAAHYHAPDLSLAGGHDSAEVDAALGMLWNGRAAQAIPQLEKLATQGDVKAALFLGGIYRQKSKLPVAPDPNKAIHFYELASQRGSGEGSERIAEMLEHHEVSDPDGRDAAYWRALAVRQGWIQQELVVVCMDWIHGPKPLNCEHPSSPVHADPLVADGCPSVSVMARLRDMGLTGTLRQDAAQALRSDGPFAKAILIMDRPVASEQDLKQPYAASVVYLQTPERWRMLPAQAPLLDRYIILTPNSGGSETNALAQAPDGSATGGACGPIRRPQAPQLE